VFWSGGAVSNIGAHMQLAALGWVVAVATRSAFRVTLITFVGVVPLLLLGPVGGALADRLAKRRLLLITQTLMMMQAFALWIVWETGAASYWVLFGLSCVGGVLIACNTPAWQSLVPELVPRSYLQNAIMLNSTQFNVARAAGPMIAGILLANVGAGWCFLVNALTFLVVLAALVAISPTRPVALEGQEYPRLWRGFADGVRYLRNHAGLVVAITTHGAFALLAAPIAALTPVLAVEVLDVGAEAYGVLLGAFGVGAVAIAFVIGTLDTRAPASRILAGGLLLAIGAIAALAVAPNLLAGVVAMAVYGAAYVTVVTVVHTTIQRLSDDRIRGRVTSLWLMVFGTAFPIGVVSQGALADVIGLRGVLGIDAALLGAALAYTVVRRLLPRIDESGD
jgi:MFS family permease